MSKSRLGQEFKVEVKVNVSQDENYVFVKIKVRDLRSIQQHHLVKVKPKIKIIRKVQETKAKNKVKVKTFPRSKLR